MDGYGSHLTYEFWSFAKEYKIFLFRLPPDSTHLTPPLDVGCFQTFKHCHTQGIDRVVRLGDVELGKLPFLTELQTMRNKTFTEATIRSAWEKNRSHSFQPRDGAQQDLRIAERAIYAPNYPAISSYSRSYS